MTGIEVTMIDRHQAIRPPMGWNSFDAFGSSVTEDQFRENVDFIAKHLKPLGWNCTVIDYCWSHPSPGVVTNPYVDYDAEGHSVPPLSMDGNGRLLPAPERFPSARGGNGFAPLADYVHSRGLKFGIHIMRGIPREAVHRRLPIAGDSVSAGAIADTHSKCRWLNHMYGVDMSKPGAQRYYDSIFELYASWGVDFIKADDLTNLHVYPDLDPSLGQYAAAEIEGISRALQKCGRPMILSLSVGPTPLTRAEHAAEHSHMWRVSADLWDRWTDVLSMFYYLRAWNTFTRSGAWPDADMIPFGRLSKNGPNGPERDSLLTDSEKTALFTLWCIARSPLMLGGNLPEYDAHSLSIITNPAVIALDQFGTGNCEVYNDGERVVWEAYLPDRRRCVALFNLSGTDSEIPLAISGRTDAGAAMDLWSGARIGTLHRHHQFEVPAHGVRLIALDGEDRARTQGG